MRDNQSPKRDSHKMTAIAPDDARKFVREQLEFIAGERKPSESVKAMLGRVSNTVGFNFYHVRKLWYGEVDNIPWHEAETLRIRAAQEVNRRWELMRARQEMAKLKTDLRRAEEHEAEIARRHVAVSQAVLDSKDHPHIRQLHFWLGRDASDVD